MVKIALLDVHHENYKSLYEISGRIKQAYCFKHGYDCLVYNTENLIPTSRQKNWGRVQGILHHIHDYDWLFYLDTDILIMNHEIKVEDYIDDQYDLIVGPLPHEGHLMSSGMLIRNCRWSVEFFLDLYAQVQFIDQPYYSEGKSFATGNPCKGGYYFEQSALHFLYDTEEKYRKRIKVVPRKYFNSETETYQKGDFLIHFPGQHQKLTLMKKMLSDGYDSVTERAVCYSNNPASISSKSKSDYEKIKQKKIIPLKRKRFQA